MTKNLAVLFVLAAFLAGLGVGYALGRTSGARTSSEARSVPIPAPAASVVDIFRQAARGADEERQNCIREKLGAERTAALVLNPNAATAEDQFKILPCQQR